MMAVLTEVIAKMANATDDQIVRKLSICKMNTPLNPTFI